MAGLSIRIFAEGVPPLLTADAPALVQAAIQDTTQKLAEATLASAVPGIPVDLGGVIGSGEVVIDGTGARVQYTAPEAMYVHGSWGSVPGSRSAPHWPPKGALQGWSERHGIPEFLVRRAISRNGTPLVPFLQEAAERQDGWSDIEQQGLAELAAKLGGG